MDEKQLLEGCLAGNRNAQKQLYNRYAARMYGVCLRYANDTEMANDMLQEGFIKVFMNLKSYRSEGSLEGWIRRVFVNAALEMLRKRDILKNSADILTTVERGSEKFHPEHTLNAKELLKLIHELPAGFRTIFNLYAIEGYSHREIAEMLKIAEGTSKSQYNRARMWLQKRMQHDSKLP